MGQGRRQFTDEFKQEAVALLVSSGRPLSQIASELGISPSMLRNWRKGSSGPGGRDLPASPRERSAADGARHFKKSCGHLLGTTEMRFRLIEDHQGVWPVRVMCDALSVSPSGYYAWRSRPDSLRKIANRDLLADIRRVHAQHQERYGAPRVHAELRAEGQTVSCKRVARLMRQHGIRARAPRRYRVCTTDSKHSLPGAVNLLDQNFVADRPDQIWLADITYIRTAEGWLYLAVILDLFTRKVVGWAMRDHLRAELTIAALTMAIQRQRPGAGLIHHSDRGSQGGVKWSSQHLEGGVAMTRRRRRSDRSSRAPLFSPGRPVVARRDEQRRLWAAS